jgi:hypothetical protein
MEQTRRFLKKILVGVSLKIPVLIVMIALVRVRPHAPTIMNHVFPTMIAIRDAVVMKRMLIDAMTRHTVNLY